MKFVKLSSPCLIQGTVYDDLKFPLKDPSVVIVVHNLFVQTKEFVCGHEIVLFLTNLLLSPKSAESQSLIPVDRGSREPIV